ncbi:MAG: hypothetical protein M0017_00140 [Desulfobacteraceae bacterium]|nr:hypothetical protein [Desulfobacteraceae bacterium]
MAMIATSTPEAQFPVQSGGGPVLLRNGLDEGFSPGMGEAGCSPVPAREGASFPAPFTAAAASNGLDGNPELLRLRERAFAEIGALRAEIDRLAAAKEQTRAELRRLLQDCLASLDACGALEGAQIFPPEASARSEGTVPPFSRVLHGLANPARGRLNVAGWEQAPMLLVVALILLQQLVPTLQRMALLG